MFMIFKNGQIQMYIVNTLYMYIVLCLSLFLKFDLILQIYTSPMSVVLFYQSWLHVDQPIHSKLMYNACTALLWLIV